MKYITALPFRRGVAFGQAWRRAASSAWQARPLSARVSRGPGPTAGRRPPLVGTSLGRAGTAWAQRQEGRALWRRRLGRQIAGAARQRGAWLKCRRLCTLARPTSGRGHCHCRASEPQPKGCVATARAHRLLPGFLVHCQKFGHKFTTSVSLIFFSS